MKKEKNRVQEIDALNHIFGQYIAFSFNDPKHYPDKPLITKSLEEKRKKTDMMSDDDMQKTMIGITTNLGGKIN